ncbi:MAG: YCF48-related protein, partial [Acidobacteriota bacterium]
QGWIVGSNGTFLETIDGGLTWNARIKFTQDTIRDIYFENENHGWALVEKDAFGSYGSSPSYILETFDSGINWKKVNLEGEGKEKLVKIFFSKDGFGRAVGEAGTFFAMQEDKSTWKKTSVPVRFLLLNGSFFNQNSGLVVGGGGTALYTEDGGNSWNTSSFTNKATSKLNSVFFTNPKVGWAVGAEGKIFTTVNGGKLWREQNSKITQDLFDVFFINTAEGWAIGNNGLILHTTTAGNIWTPIQNNVRHKLERIFFAGKVGWAVGFGGTVLKYEGNSLEKNEAKPTPVLQKRNYSALD